MITVLDASALLAYLHSEPGAEAVEAVLSESAISTVNWAEVCQKALVRGVDIRGMADEFTALGLEIKSFTIGDAEQTARLGPLVQAGGLSLGDRACLALGLRLQAPVLTADRAWLAFATDLALSVQTIH